MPTIELGRHKKRERTINKTMYQKVYQDKRWIRVRTLKFKNNPLCELCLLEGRVTPTEEVHHIIPIDVYDLDEELAFDIDNLQSLCVQCHKKVHQTIHKHTQKL